MKWLRRTCCGTCDHTTESLDQLRVGLIGNPNCGKTTLFNALTGSCQRVGNWPGVTVERKTGCFSVNGVSIELIDLPGIYSLTTPTTNKAIDERIACDFMLNHQADVILNIVDASNLERNLYLTLQLMETGIPVVLGLNMMDVARDKGLHIKVTQLAKELGCTVVPIVAKTEEGISLLKDTLAKKIKHICPIQVPYPKLIQEAIADLNDTPYPIRLLEGNEAGHWQARITKELGEDADILIADSRYQLIQNLYAKYVIKSAKPVTSVTEKIDAIFLNRWLGIPIFLMVMYVLFFFAIKVGGFFQDYFNSFSNAIFVEGFSRVLTMIHTPAALIGLLANGVGKGINTVISFIPVIGAMFIGLAFLEDSGYMARAAFIIDRLMRALGLPGKSFVPMIVGFGCNVPAVMGARTLENPRDRILTVMMTPFMSCGARLAIYAVFTAAFFPGYGQNIVFSLYLFGIAMAVFTGWILRSTVLPGKPAPLIMELPSYHWPKTSILLRHAWQRLRGFVLRAGKLIVPICILLGMLNSLMMNGQSLLSHFGQWLTPVFSPMGIHSDNWPATVGLLTGVLAKEVVVGTLNSLYAPGALAQHFDGVIGAIAYLLFVLLYFPCVSTVAVMWREVNRYWACFSVLWTTGLAYVVAVTFYQIAKRVVI